MVWLIRKRTLPRPDELPAAIAHLAEEALRIELREPRPSGFPLMFSKDWELLEVANAYLHEHAVVRSCTTETLRTYAEILHHWYEDLERRGVAWDDVDASDIVRYRNSMVTASSPKTSKPYSVATVNHRIRGVLRFYDWAARNRWCASPLIVGIPRSSASHQPSSAFSQAQRNPLVIRQHEEQPRPLAPRQLLELMAALRAPYDLMARWQAYTGLRISELLSLTTAHIEREESPSGACLEIHIIRKGRKRASILAPFTLIQETKIYAETHRAAWLARRKRRHCSERSVDALFVNLRGKPVAKSSYQRVVRLAGAKIGTRVTTHVLRATFACMLLSRLEQLASGGAAINPLLIVKILMGHERIETTDRYLRAVSTNNIEIDVVLERLLDH